jgi:hypothetical protein
MKIISHRGNLTGPNLVRENSLDYIEEAIVEEFEVEIDLWVEDDQCYLGHDEPQYLISTKWLEKYKNILWIHCKNREALEKMSSASNEFNYFWHETDRYTITSKGIGWIYIGQYPYSKSVVVLPEKISLYQFPHGIEYMKNSYGVCSDNPVYYRELLK